MTRNEQTNTDSNIDTVDNSDNDLVVESEQEPEWQKAQHEIGTKNLDAANEDHPVAVQNGSTDSVKQKLEEEVILDYLSDKIYGGPEATFREYEANAETAIIEAAKLELRNEQGWTDSDFIIPRDDNPNMMREMYPYEILQETDLSPLIEISWHKDKQIVVIRDNGIGFTPREVTDVLSYTGRSGVRDDGSVSGQFGMGVLSFVKATGKKGGITIITRTRRTDVPDYAQKSFAMYGELGDYNLVQGELPPGQFGTRFEIPLKDGIEEKHSSSYSDEPVIRKWISKYSEWMRVPVLYEEFENGETVYDEEYGQKEFVSDYDGPRVVIDRPELYAFSSPTSDGETLLLSMPIERNASNKPYNSPWYVDIRLRNENGVVVECESDPSLTGLQTVEEEEYNNMSSDRQEKFAVKSNLPSDAVVTPEPKANRDGLEDNRQFWKWIGNELDQKYKQKVHDLTNKINSPDDIEQLARNNPNQFSFVMKTLRSNSGYGNKTANSISKRFKSKLDVEFSDETTEMILHLIQKTSHAPRNRSGISKKRNRTSTVTWEIYRDAIVNDGTVYMGVNVNESRAKVAWESDDNNEVIRVGSTSNYRVLGNKLGFEKLKTVPMSKDNDDDDRFTIPSNLNGSTKDSNAGREAQNRTITVRRTAGRDNMATLSVGKIESKLSDPKSDGIDISYYKTVSSIVLFPASTDRTMSEHYDVAIEDRAVATCTEMVYEYLQDTPGIMHIDDFVQDAEDTVIETSEGQMTVKEAGDRLLVHVVDDDYIDMFRQDTVMTHLAGYMTEKLKEDARDEWNYDFDEQYPDEFIYAPVDRDAWRRMQPSGLTQTFVVVSGDMRARSCGGAVESQLTSDASIYAVARFTDWDSDVAELDAIRQLTLDANEGDAMNVIESLGMLHDNGINPFSEQGDDVVLNQVKQDNDDDVVDGMVADGGE